MSTLGSKLITKEMQWNANMTEQNHLGAALIAKPERLVSTMDQLFSAQNYYSDNPLFSFLIGSGVGEKTISSTSWEWDLKGANTRPLISVGNINEASNTTLGKWGRPFKLKLDENWYLAGDYIHPGTSNKKFQLRIQDNPIPDGDGWVYTVVMASGGPNDFLPVQFLNYGQQWGKLYSKYEEGAEQSGSTQFSLPISLSNRLGLYRKQYKITNYASTEVLAVAIPDSNGKMHNSWIRYAEVEYWKQWYKELERGNVYSRSSDIIKGANGRQVRNNPGLQEQLEDSHIHHYSQLSARLIEDYLMDIFYGRTSPGRGRHVKGYTGEYGMIEFHRAISAWADKSGFIKNVEQYTSKTKSPYHSNALAAGYQFVRYDMANGSSLELVHAPLYDDRSIHYEIDEITGYPVESQRITFLDFTGEGKGSNIQIVNKKDGNAFTYVEGLYGPYGPKSGGSSAHSGSYYEMHVEKSMGIHVGDVTKCGELILKRSY